MPANTHSAWQSAIVIAGLALGIGIVFGASIGYPFVNYDDPHYVINNYGVQQGFDLQSLRWAFTTGYAENWHPMTWLSHMADFVLYGMNPGAHRLTNILLHLGSAIALFYVLRALSGAHWRSAAVAALFAIHPLHVESVIWVAERKDVLSGLFFMLSLAAYVSWRERSGPVRYGTLVLVFAAGLLSKSMLVTLPCVLLLLDFWPLKRFDRAQELPRFVVEKLPLFALSALFCVITFLVQRAGGTMKTFDSIPFWARAANAVQAYTAYLWKTIYPVELAVLYPHPGVDVSWLLVAMSLIFLIALTALAWRLRRRAPYFLVGWLWYIGTLVPVIGLVQVGDQAYADRYTYLPIIGVFIVICWGIPDLWQRVTHYRSMRPLAYATAAMLLVLTTLATLQARHWSSSIALFERCVAVTPNNPAAYNNLGRAYHNAGRMDDAVAAYRAALAQGPHLVMARNNLAIVLLELGAFPEAESVLREAIAIAPDDCRMQLNFGIALAAQGRKSEAAAAMHRAVDLMPNLVPARFSLGSLLLDEGHAAEAVPHFEAVIALQPGHIEARSNLAQAYADLGRDEEAARQRDAAAALSAALSL